MTRGPAEALQKAIFAALIADTNVVAAFGDKPPQVFDEVPASDRNGPRFPYIVIGEDQVLDDSDCGAAFECFSTIHVYSRNRGSGKLEAKAIGDAISAAIGDASGLGVTGFVPVTSEFEPAFQDSRYFYETDGLTAHGVLLFRILLDQGD